VEADVARQSGIGEEMMTTAWTESKLACLWRKEKTRRLLAAGTLRPYHIDDEGERCFSHDDVMEHYQYKSAKLLSVN
jgi:hypothetical protein